MPFLWVESYPGNFHFFIFVGGNLPWVKFSPFLLKPFETVSSWFSDLVLWYLVWLWATAHCECGAMSLDFVLFGSLYTFRRNALSLQFVGLIFWFFFWSFCLKVELFSSIFLLSLRWVSFAQRSTLYLQRGGNILSFVVARSLKIEARLRESLFSAALWLTWSGTSVGALSAGSSFMLQHMWMCRRLL